MSKVREANAKAEELRHACELDSIHSIFNSHLACPEQVGGSLQKEKRKAELSIITPPPARGTTSVRGLHKRVETLFLKLNFKLIKGLPKKHSSRDKAEDRLLRRSKKKLEPERETQLQLGHSVYVQQREKKRV